MNFKIGDMIASNKDSKQTTTDGLIKGRVNYVVRDSKIIIVEILEHEESYYIGRETAYINEGNAFKLYEEPETPESIVFKTKNFNAVVYRNGRKTIAKDRDTGETAVAICSPEDTYDFMTGAIIAMARLTCTDTLALERMLSQR